MIFHNMHLYLSVLCIFSRCPSSDISSCQAENSQTMSVVSITETALVRSESVQAIYDLKLNTKNIRIDPMMLIKDDNAQISQEHCMKFITWISTYSGVRILDEQVKCVLFSGLTNWKNTISVINTTFSISLARNTLSFELSKQLINQKSIDDIIKIFLVYMQYHLRDSERRAMQEQNKARYAQKTDTLA